MKLYKGHRRNGTSCFGWHRERSEMGHKRLNLWEYKICVVFIFEGVMASSLEKVFLLFKAEYPSVKVGGGVGKSLPAVVFAAGCLYQNFPGSLQNQPSEQQLPWFSSDNYSKESARVAWLMWVTCCGDSPVIPDLKHKNSCHEKKAPACLG